MISNTSDSIKNIHKLSIAPMMDCTDKHFRMIMRKISSEALLYTEMIVAQSLVYTNKKGNFLDFNSDEQNKLRKAAQIFIQEQTLMLIRYCSIFFQWEVAHH